ncbi:MAG: sensor histidine kinase [Nitrospirae bacterium]|nr:sensor histidine kinase [Nitrospirota bacterium]
MQPEPRKKGLRTKTILALLLVGSIPVVVGLGVTYWNGTSKLRASMGENFQGLALEVSRTADLVIEKEIISKQHLSTTLGIQALLEISNQKYPGFSEGEIDQRLTREAGQWKTASDNPLKDHVLLTAVSRELRNYTTTRGERYLAFFVTDEKGALVASANEFPDYLYGKTEWWQKAYNRGAGRVYIGDLYFNEKAQTHAIHIAVPVMDPDGRKAVGVLAVFHDVRRLLDSTVSVIRLGATGHAMLIDSSGQVLICPVIPTGSFLTDKKLVADVVSSTPKWVLAEDDGHGGKDSIIGFAPLVRTSNITLDSTGKTWHSFIRQGPKELYAPINSLLESVFLSGVILIGSVAVLGFFLSRRLIRPIQQLQEGAEAIGRGNLDVRVGIRTNDEIEQLAMEFNQMAQKLKESYSTLEQKVADRTKELSDMNIQLQEADRFKSEFFSNISHEFRTPLTSIMGYSQFILEEIGDDLTPKQRESILNIQDSGTLLLEFINNLLDLSRIKANKMELHFGEFSIRSLFSSCLRAIRPMALKKSLKLESRIQDGGLIIWADEIKVKQILLNLLSNAVKFSHPQGTILVEARSADPNGKSTIELSVTDTGIGIRKEDLGRIFEEFRQADSSYTREYGGSGLGLTIVKQFAEMLGGEIQVESEFHKGSRFTLSLPRRMNQERFEQENA